MLVCKVQPNVCKGGSAAQTTMEDSKVTIDFVRDRIINEAICRNERGETSGATLIVQRGRDCQKGENHGRSKLRRWSKSRTKGEAECWNCGRKGHLKRDCKAPKKAKKRGDEFNSVDPANDEEEPNPQEPVLRRSTRVRKPNIRYLSSLNKSLLTNSDEPEDCSEAVGSSDAVKWEQAMKELWALTQLLEGKKALQHKWVYGVKEGHDGGKRYGARLVVKGFLQKKGIDYIEIFSPVVKLTTTRMIFGIVATENLNLKELDVRTVFLYGDLKEEIYMSDKGLQVLASRGLLPAMKSVETELCEPCLLYKLKRVSFLKVERERKGKRLGLGQANMWGSTQICKACVLDRQKRVSFSKIGWERKGEMLELGCTDVWGPALVQSQGGLRFHVSSADGSLKFSMVCTRPDIAHVVGVVSRHTVNPGTAHWEAVKWLLRYLKGTSSMALCFEKGSVSLEGSVVANLGGDGDSRNSTIDEDGILSLKKIIGTLNPASKLTKVVTTDELRLCTTSVGLNH